MLGRIFAAAFVAAPLAILPALAAEENIQLKQAAGVETVMQNCGACHSLDYIPMNSPFLDKAGWTAEVTKMVNALGAPVPADEQAKIIDYLAANYGK